MKSNKLWLIKYTNGRVQGPLNTQEIIDLIVSKKAQGEESIAAYPNGNWQSISIESVFYEQLLKILSENKSKKPAFERKTGSEKESLNSISVSQGTHSSHIQTVVADVSELHSLHKKRAEQQQKRKDSLKKKRKNKNQKSQETVIYSLDEDDSFSVEQSVIEDESVSKNKYFFKKILIFLCVGVAVFLFWPEKKNKNFLAGEYVQLKVPRKKQAKKDETQVKNFIVKGLVYYLKSSVDSSVKAQDLFVSAIEGDDKNVYAMAMLCMVHYDLWPFTKRDFIAEKAIIYLVGKTSMLNKGGVLSGLCSTVNLLIKGQYVEAKTMIESSLDGLERAPGHDASSQRIKPMLYYLNSKVLFYLKQHSVALSYLQSLNTMIPKWIAPYLLTGQILFKDKKIGEAYTVYNNILKKQASHKKSQIQVAVMEYKFFNKPEKAEAILKKALSSSERVSYDLLSEAYFILAEIYFNRKNLQKALSYAQESYKYNPGNQISKNLIMELGGLDLLKTLPVKMDQLIHTGDQMVLNNKFKSAIGYYEEAFNMGKQQNAMIAVKIAKSYWTLSFSNQAISWLKKAININPDIMESYVLLSRYYSDKYDFFNAEKILQIAFQKPGRSYELYRGSAYLSLKKGAYQKAVRFAKNALKIYESDIKSYVILSEAYRKLGENDEALATATRGLEIDPNAQEIQIAYAKALGSVYGVDTGYEYFYKLIKNYPLIIAFRMDLAKYLFEEERYISAKEQILQILNIEPKYKEAYFYLGRIYMFENDFNAAYEAFLQDSILDSSNPQSSFYIGQLRLKERKLNESRSMFNRVLRLNDKYPKARFYLGKVAFEKKEYEEAIEQARKEIRLNPNLIFPYILVAQSYEQLKKFSECAVEYQKAIELDPSNLNLYVRTARCYRKSGLLDLAVQILKKAHGENRKFQSGDPHLYRELGVIYEIKQDYPEALASYCNYLNLLPQAPDRRDIETRMNKLSSLTGKKMQNCG